MLAFLSCKDSFLAQNYVIWWSSSPGVFNLWSADPRACPRGASKGPWAISEKSRPFTFQLNKKYQPYPFCKLRYRHQCTEVKNCTSDCLMLNMSEVWTRLSLTVQQTATVVVLASVFPGILVALRQSHQCFATILYDVLVQNCIFCCYCYKDQVQVNTGHWTWHTRMFITHITTFGPTL